MKTFSYYKSFVVVVGLAVVSGLGAYISNQKQADSNGRSLASKEFSFDKKLSELAAKKVVEQVKTGRNIDLGFKPSPLEKFLFEDLKGEFSLEIEPKKALKLKLANNSIASVKILDSELFIRRALDILFESPKNFKLVENSRNLASELLKTYTLIDEAGKEQFQIYLEISDLGVLRGLTAKSL